MDANETLQFAFDWPIYPGFPLICCTCGRKVWKKNAIRHMDRSHPGWLDAWNAALDEHGLHYGKGGGRKNT